MKPSCMNNLLTAVELTEEQALLFRIFMEHYSTIEFMTKSGVWDIKGGNAILNFDSTGHLKSVKKETFTYQT